MPNRTDEPAVYDDTVPYKEKLKQWKKNSFHIDGGEIYETLTEYVRDREPKDYGEGISPSGLGGCPRQLWFKMMGIDPTTPAGIGTMTTWEMGFQYERTMVKAHYKKGTLRHWFPDKPEDATVPGVPDELTTHHDPFKYTLPSGTPLIGTPDFLIDYGKLLTVADAKTSRSDSFQYVGPTQEELKEEKMGYFWQTAAYLILLNKNLDKLKAIGIEGPVKQGLVYIYDKDSGIPKRELLVRPTADEYKKVAEMADLTWKHFKAGTLPPCYCADSTWWLEYCDYGNPETQTTTKKGKRVNHECCEIKVVLDAFKKAVAEIEKNDGPDKDILNLTQQIEKLEKVAA